MLRAFLLSAILSTALNVAHAEVLVVRQDVVAKSANGKTEVTVFSGDSENDRLKIVNLLRLKLAEDLRDNPQLFRSFERVDDSALDSSALKADAIGKSFEAIAPEIGIQNRVLKADTLSVIRKKFPIWFAENRYKLTFSLIRGGLNGGITFWSLVVSSHLPIPVALTTGIVTGSMSGGMQFWSEPMRQFLSKSLVKQMFPENLIAAKVAKIEPFARWYILEVGFVTVIELVLRAFEDHPDEDFWTTEKKTATTAFISLIAQGFWDVGVSQATKDKLARALTEQLQKKIQLRADLIGLGISVASVSAVVARVMGLDLSWYLFGAMGATGITYFVKTLPKKQRCESTLEEIVPEPPENEGAIDLNERPQTI